MKIEVSYFDIYIKLDCQERENAYNSSEILERIELVAKKVIDIYLAGKKEEAPEFNRD
ncbi:MAG: hypothetical protein IID03_12805 [Candidatus Dadabacteria bacterium]|nr:hypothetical protein [Candidatus Dadabacteria bacterium]